MLPHRLGGIVEGCRRKGGTPAGKLRADGGRTLRKMVNFTITERPTKLYSSVRKYAIQGIIEPGA